jgi:hypothetical protein
MQLSDDYTTDTPCYVFATHAEASAAIEALKRNGFDMQKLSLIGKSLHQSHHDHTDGHPSGFYTLGNKIKAWGSTGALTGGFWGGIWGLLLAPAVFLLPGFGIVAMAGPFVTTLVGALEGAADMGGTSAMAAALAAIGLPEEQVLHFEAALRGDHYVLIVHGSAAEVAAARGVLLQHTAPNAA